MFTKKTQMGPNGFKYAKIKIKNHKNKDQVSHGSDLWSWYVFIVHLGKGTIENASSLDY